MGKNSHIGLTLRKGFGASKVSHVASAWVTAVSNWLPVIQLVGVILLLKYVIDTAAIKRATHQPLLVLDHKPRDPDDQILDQSGEPTPATELAETILVRNIGEGPAYGVAYTFDGVEGIGTWRSTAPYLKTSQGTEPAISKMSIKRGTIKFEATYSSLAHVRFQSRQVLSDGVLGPFTVRRFGIFRQSYAFLKQVNQAIHRKAKERRARKRITGLYP